MPGLGVPSNGVTRCADGEFASIGNADCPWDLFDSKAYLERNYRTVHELDQVIIGHLGKFFARFTPTEGWRGIDVGSGTNLYPALAMMPLAEKITLLEHSAANVDWLQHVPVDEVAEQPWEQFWIALGKSADMYRNCGPWEELYSISKIEKGNVFDLPSASWNIGTMFFVAESITGKHAEFKLATRKFLASLLPGAPFAATFMEGSRGYWAGRCHLPAVAIGEADIREIMETEGADFEVHRITSPEQFRNGYEGMILVTGTTRKAALQ